MSERVVALGRRFARVTTRAVVARPRLWPLFRPLMRRQFDALAPGWQDRRQDDSHAPLLAALDRLEEAPGRILDVGTGTGLAARLLASRFPEADVVGVDLSPAMIAEARRLTRDERVRYEVADASRLPFEDGSFDLVVLLNMIPFFGEVARVAAPGGAIVAGFSSGESTPIYVPPAALRRGLEPLGFTRVEEVRAGRGLAVLARR